MTLVSPRNRVSALRAAVCETLELRRLLAANLVISEFLASNSTGLKDSYGDHEDWIELHNAGDVAANLNDYFLTDDASNLEEYRLPTQSLAAGGYLVVFASGKNLVTPAGEIHTNFKLSASGEYLGLINAADDSVQFDYSPTFPAQTSDVSYGLFDANDPSSAKVYFNTPTPGAANSPTAAPVSYSVAGETFTGSLGVTLSDTTANSKIYYTTNGSSPTSASTLYTAPLSLTNTTLLRTVAYATGLGSSLVTSNSYIALNASSSTTATLGSSTLSSFTSNLPIVTINTYGTPISDSVDNAASIDFIDTSNGTASALGGTSDYIGRTGFRIRGSTSESYPKQQYALELWDENNNDKKASLLGLPSDSDWVLYAPYTEQIMMQNALAYQWSNEMGHYASRTQYCEVFLNTSSVTAGGTASPTTASDYVGIYILEEKIKVDSNRVDVDDLSASNPAGGFVVAQDRYSGQDYFTTPQGVHIVLKDPDDTSLESTMQTEWDNFENALFTGTAGANQAWDTPGNASYYGNYINVGSWVDYYLLNEMTRNVDAFWLSTYYTMGDGTIVNGAVQQGLISAGPVWDFNLSLGVTNYQDAANAENWDTNTLSPASGAAGVTGFNPQDPYFQRLLTDPNFDQAVADRWEQLRSGVFSTSKLVSDIDANVAILANGTTNYPVGSTPTQPATDPIVRNFIRWPELGTPVTTDSDYDPAGSWIADVNIAKSWLTARVNWMDSQYVPAPTLTPGGSFAGSTSVAMTPIGQALTTDTQLIGANAPVYYKIPTANIPSWQTLSATSLPAGWTQGTTGLGYDLSTSGTGAVSFLPYIATNLQTAMYRKSATVYTLMNFTVTDPTQIQALVLKAYYDDGFIAWVNGVRVMDANSPENTTSPGYTTASAGSGNDNLAITNREFDITAVKSLLKAGNNTLAIQGLNSGTGSDDFLLDPTLYARTYSYPTAGAVYYTTDGSDPRLSGGGISSTAKLYSGAVALSSSSKVQARTLVNGVWSALATQVYEIGSNPLRITELMYDPPDDQNYEFIKVQNTAATPLNLSGYTFTNGVTFTFPNSTLAAGASAVIVHNLTSFATRYGTQFNVLGAYGGSLDNSGETVAFADGFGTTVQSFKYDPTWYASTKAGGAALKIVNPAGDKANWSLASGWTASFDDSPVVVNSNSVGTGTTFSVAVNFRQNLSTTTNLSALSMINLSTGTAVANASIVPTVSGNNLLLGFTGYPSGVLSDGWYQATIPASGVTTASGVPLAAAYTFSFFVLAGDANHDGKVDISDLGLLSGNWQMSGVGYAGGDFNYDGKVDVSDLGILSGNWQKSIGTMPAAKAIKAAPKPVAKPTPTKVKVSGVARV